MVKPTINSRKHIVQFTKEETGGIGTILNKVLVDVVDPADINAAFEVREGCIIKAVYLDCWVTADSTNATASVTVSLEKKPNNSPVMTFLQSQTLDDYTNKKNIFSTFQGLVGPDDQVAIAPMRGWYKIPKGKQRFGKGDRLMLNISGVTDSAFWCGLCIYKEYY